MKTGYSKWFSGKKDEKDFGLCWLLVPGDENLWRISWIKNTGELYAVCQKTDQFIILGVFSDKQVEKKMKGFFDKTDEMIISKWFEKEVKDMGLAELYAKHAAIAAGTYVEVELKEKREKSAYSKTTYKPYVPKKNADEEDAGNLADIGSLLKKKIKEGRK